MAAAGHPSAPLALAAPAPGVRDGGGRFLTEVVLVRAVCLIGSLAARPPRGRFRRGPLRRVRYRLRLARTFEHGFRSACHALQVGS